MPRRVSFSESNHYSRLPHDDELYVMKAFSRHADNCDTCYDPYQVYKDGSTLCPRGHQRAIDVAQYVYMRGGQSFSQVDRERNQKVQIEVPANCEAVRQLLKAMDRGLRLMRKNPPTSYDKSYYVPARLSVPDNQRSTPATRSSAATPTTSKQPIFETIAPSTSRSRPETQAQSRSRARATSTSSTSSTDSSSRRHSRSATRTTTRPHFIRAKPKDGRRSSSPIYVRSGVPPPQQQRSNSTTTETLPRSSSTRSSLPFSQSHRQSQHSQAVRQPHSRNGSSSSTSSRSSISSLSSISSFFTGRSAPRGSARDSHGRRRRAESVSSISSVESTDGEEGSVPVLVGSGNKVPKATVTAGGSSPPSSFRRPATGPGAGPEFREPEYVVIKPKSGNKATATSTSGGKRREVEIVSPPVSPGFERGR